MVKKSENDRSALLREADEIINNDRLEAYGPASDEFLRFADILTAAGYSFRNKPLDNWNIPHILNFLKLLRLSQSPKRRDTWRDIAGYAALGAEIVQATDE